MKALTTKYVGPTDHSGSRIIASEPDGKRVIKSWDSELSDIDNHREAAYALLDKMAWKGKLAGGFQKPRTYVWVFVG